MCLCGRGSGGVIGKSTRGIRLECARVCAHTGVRQETFEAVAPVNSFTNTRRCPLDGGSCRARAGGPGDYTANLGTDRGHLCPSKKTPGLESHAVANKRRTAQFFFSCCFGFFCGGVLAGAARASRPSLRQFRRPSLGALTNLECRVSGPAGHLHVPAG